MRNPSTLDVVPEAEELAVLVYRVTRDFPRDERFGLTAQVRRAAVSVGSNIVEGCHRGSDRAFLAFLYQALGSAGEVEYQLRLATRLGFGDANAVNGAKEQAGKVTRMLINFVNAVRAKVA